MRERKDLYGSRGQKELGGLEDEEIVVRVYYIIKIYFL